VKDPSKIIDALGGNKQVASECGITEQAVSLWRRNGIPKGYGLYFKNKYPELFGRKAR
jgi:hypothetical protein